MKKMGGLSGLMDKLPSQLTAKAGPVDVDKAERDVVAWKESSAR
jgi:signal recognition particle subunit SRP54